MSLAGKLDGWDLEFIFKGIFCTLKDGSIQIPEVILEHLISEYGADWMRDAPASKLSDESMAVGDYDVFSITFRGLDARKVHDLWERCIQDDIALRTELRYLRIPGEDSAFYDRRAAIREQKQRASDSE